MHTVCWESCSCPSSQRTEDTWDFIPMWLAPSLFRQAISFIYKDLTQTRLVDELGEAAAVRLGKGLL